MNWRANVIRKFSGQWYRNPVTCNPHDVPQWAGFSRDCHIPLPIEAWWCWKGPHRKVQLLHTLYSVWWGFLAETFWWGGLLVAMAIPIDRVLVTLRVPNKVTYSKGMKISSRSCVLNTNISFKFVSIFAFIPHSVCYPVCVCVFLLLF